MKKIFLLLAVSIVASVFCSCCSVPDVQPIISFHKTTDTITLDGKLDEEAWSKAEAAVLVQGNDWQGRPEKTAAAYAASPYEGGYMKFLYDDEYLYIGVHFDDIDAIQLAKEDQEMLIVHGDTAEFFLRPLNTNCYWEFYTSPTAKKASFIYDECGYNGIVELFQPEGLMPTMEAASFVKGTVNDKSDDDEYWSSEIRIPIAELEKSGQKFSPLTPWTAFCARYNYSKGLRAQQFGYYPALPRISFHLLEYYAPVVFK